METSAFYIYDASAGSGKTYTITKEYLSILLEQDKSFAFQNILAITFTNKAAAEMKQRIISALIHFAGLGTTDDFDSLLDDIAQQTKLSTSEIQKKSFNILKFLIPNYASFEVSTIDSFNHRIIRTFARDLSITQNFEIDMDSAPYIQQAIEQLVDEVGENKELTTWLIEFVKYKVNNNKSGNIEKDLVNYAELILNENNYEALELIQKFSLDDLKHIKSKIISYQNHLLKDLKSLAEEFFEVIETHHLDPKDFKGRFIPKYFNKLAEGNILNKFSAAWHNITETKFYNVSAKDHIKAAIDSIRPDIEELFLTSKTKSLEYHLADRVLKNFVPLAMISEVQKRLKAIKEEKGILFINDFNRIISQHISKQPAPFIYERLGEKFRHYFIDEFQDTSKLQWQNLKPLVENAITMEHTDGTSGHLYLVGDVKQSIYEWRGGDPQQFLDLSQGHDQPFSVKSKRKVLEHNWRSAKEVVNFNNSFFEFAAQKLSNPKHQKLYANAAQHHKKTKQGYVEIQLMPEIKDKKEQLDYRVSALKTIIDEVKDSGFALKDICILVRKNKQGSALAEAFNDLKDSIPVVSQESLLIASDNKVNILIKFLNFIHAYNQESCIDFALEWLLYTDIDNEILTTKLHQLKDANFIQAIDELKTFGLELNLNLYRQLSLYDKTEYVIRLLGFDHNANVYLQFFLDEIFDYAQKKSPSMQDFLSYWEEVKTRKSITTSKNIDAVNIMTIHKSKGLEFPVVIYAEANFILADLGQTNDWISLDENKFGIPYFYSSISKSICGLSTAVDKAYSKNISKEELSNMNNAYVAMTRAEEQLYILSEPITHSKDEKFEDLLKGFLESQSLFDKSKSKYSFGQKGKRPKKEAKVISVNSGFDSYSTEQFYNSLTADEVIHRPTSSQQIYGQDVHDLLQNIVYKDDLSKIHAEKEILNKLKNIINHETLSAYFENDWRVYNETDLVYDHQILRPDRVCTKGKEAVILDYKTGTEREVHQEQLTSYKAALEAMGFSIKSAFLVYIRKTIYIKTV